MKNLKHTPGPWLVHDSYEEDGKIIVWDGDEQAHKEICDMGEMGDMNYAQELANAKLIAVAPEMYQAMQEFCDRVEKGEVRSTKTYNKFKEILNKITDET